MHASDRFMRFAAECEAMAKCRNSPGDKLVWRRLAQRWMHCADLVRNDNPTTYIARLRKRQLRVAHGPTPLA